MHLFDRLFGINKTNSSNLKEDNNIINTSNNIETKENTHNRIKTTDKQINDENTHHEITISNFDEAVIGDDDTNECEIGYDEFFIEAGIFIIEKKRAAIGMLQRRFKIGFNRAARIMNQLVEAGVVGPENGTQPRKLLMTLDEFEKYVEHYSISEKIIKQINKEASDKTPEESDDIIDTIEQLLNNAKGLSSKQIFKDSDTITADLLSTRFNKPSDFSKDNVQILEEQGNTIVPSCDYDAVLDFMELLLGKCSANDLQLLLIDTDVIFNLYNGFPHLFITCPTSETI